MIGYGGPSTSAAQHNHRGCFQSSQCPGQTVRAMKSESLDGTQAEAISLLSQGWEPWSVSLFNKRCASEPLGVLCQNSYAKTSNLEPLG